MRSMLSASRALRITMTSARVCAGRSFLVWYIWASSFASLRLPLVWDCMGPARPGRSRAPGARLEKQVAAAPVWHDRPCHLLESTDAGLTERMFCANTHLDARRVGLGVLGCGS